MTDLVLAPDRNPNFADGFRSTLGQAKITPHAKSEEVILRLIIAE